MFSPGHAWPVAPNSLATPEQTEEFNKSFRSGPGYNKNSLDQGVNLKHLPVEHCVDATVACKSTMAQKKENLKQVLYPLEVDWVTQCHTWDLLEKIICGDRKIHAQATMEILTKMQNLRGQKQAIR